MKSYKKLVAIMLAAFVLCCSSVLAADDVTKYQSCKICGMDRGKWNYSRVLVEYNDGSSEGYCSIQCAAAGISGNLARFPKTMLVADYNTKELIDAKQAVWVMGGKQPGVMTSTAKWAFADKSAAETFVKENGGEPASFEQVMKAAQGDKQGKADHSGHEGHEGPRAQMLYNPAFGDSMYHTHPAGMWMFNYKYMHTSMHGLQAGTAGAGSSNVGYMRNKPFNYMMIPTSMSMDMHMAMLMYGITDRITAMVMANYAANKMNMFMDMGPMMGVFSEPAMYTAGFGDMEARGIVKITDFLNASLGLGIPTGSIRQQFQTMGRTYRAPYDMQPGTGTWKLKPALTCNFFSSDSKWNLGVQATYVGNLGKNDAGWSPSDSLLLSTWLQRVLGPFTGSLRLAYSLSGGIVGSDPEIQKSLNPNPRLGAPMPDADPRNYGGQRLDGLIGLSYKRGHFSVGVEGGKPLYQYLNGLQLKTDWILNSSVQFMF